MNDEDYIELFGMTKAELMNKGMMCLIHNLGILEAQTYIANIMQEGRESPPNYTEYQQKHFDNMTDEEFKESLNEFIKNHPHE